MIEITNLPTGEWMINNWAFWSTLHLLWLEFLAMPFIVYLGGQGLAGAILPALFSLFIITHDWKILARLSMPFHKLLIGGTLFCAVIGTSTGYWSTLGYHFLDAGLLLWPVIALLTPDFRAWWAYPLTFFPSLFVDVFGAGERGHWAGAFWFGVGGMGFHDGLFIGPATTLICALTCSALGYTLRQRGILHLEPF